MLRAQYIEKERELAKERARTKSLEQKLAAKPTVVYNVQVHTQNIVHNHNTLIVNTVGIITEFIRKNTYKYRGIEGARNLLRLTRCAALNSSKAETRRLVHLLESKDVDADIMPEISAGADAKIITKNHY